MGKFERKHLQQIRESWVNCLYYTPLPSGVINRGNLENRWHFPSYQPIKLVVYLPLWKIWVRQIGSSSQLLGKIKAMFQTTNQTRIYRAFSSYVWWPEIPPWPCRWSPAAPRRCSFRMVFGGGDALKGYRYYKEWYRHGLDMDFMTLSESWSLCFTNRAKHVNAKLRV